MYNPTISLDKKRAGVSRSDLYLFAVIEVESDAAAKETVRQNNITIQKTIDRIQSPEEKGLKMQKSFAVEWINHVKERMQKAVNRTKERIISALTQLSFKAIAKERRVNG